MAYLNRTQSLGDTVNRQHMYDLVNTCTLGGGSVSGGGFANIVMQTEPPSAMTISQWWYDQKDQLLRVPIMSVGDSACSLWLSVGPDSLEIPVYNNNSYTITQGDLLAFAYSPAAGVYDVEITETQPAVQATYSFMVAQYRHNRNLRGIIGLSQDTMAPGAWGRCVYRGFGYGRIRDDHNASAQNVARPLFISSAYSGCAHCHQMVVADTYDKEPWAVGLLYHHPTGVDYTLPNLRPVFMWLPFVKTNSHATY